LESVFCSNPFPSFLPFWLVLTLFFILVAAAVSHQQRPVRRWWPRHRQTLPITAPACVDRERINPNPNATCNTPRFRRKPDWVLQEVLRLKALMPHSGVRRIAMTFNRLHAATNTTVGKSFVADGIAAHQHAVIALRRELRSRPPRPTKVKAIWAMDLSFHRDTTDADASTKAQQHILVGILDHGSRRVTRLVVAINRKSWTLLGHLCLAIGQHGKPKRLRTDNEAIFTSFTFRASLWLAGIAHQRIDTCAPWQNGRIERLFGSLKPLLRKLAIPSRASLQIALDEFRLFHNHVQPHQNLRGRTPAETWNGTSVAPLRSGDPKPPEFVQAMNGLLAGFYIPP
jgi:putative transposase